MGVHVLESPNLAVAFSVLKGIVREWRALDRVTTTAGLKPAFVSAMDGATERDLGFETWRAFIQAAVDSGHVRTQRLVTGHTGVILPDESVDVLAADGPREPRRQPANGRGQKKAVVARLRPDVWTTFVEWQDSHHRLWDATTSRAFMYPV